MIVKERKLRRGREMKRNRENINCYSKLIQYREENDGDRNLKEKIV